MGRAMIPHRGPVLRELYASILRRARQIHRTDGDVFTWPASGSAGWEAAIVNLLSPGDRVLVTVCGDFGDRFAGVGAAFGLDVRRVEAPWGRAVRPAQLAAALAAHDGVRAVFITHNETSTGVTNPLPELARVARDAGALVVVDAVSAMAGLPLEMDAWGLDFVLSGSQKAWMCPPGLMIAGVGPRAWDAYRRSTFPKFFWDLESARKSAAAGMTPTTPPLTLFYAFDAALDLILAEGLEHVWARHHALGEQTRAGLAALGLALFSEPAFASDTVTAFVPPPGMTASDVTAAVRRQGVELAVGQGAYKEAVVRIGHMGWCHAADIEATLAALAVVASSQ